MDLINILYKDNIVRLNKRLSLGTIGIETYNAKLEEIIRTIYDDGKEMGMVEALNFVSNEADRERLFAGIDELRESLDNQE